MPARQVAPRLLSWASDVEQSTIDQAARAARLPFVAGHVALMPDAHVGIGATVGSVIPTEGAIIPAAVGVDIGCGMVATETDLTAADLPDSLRALMPLIERRIPAGVGKGHRRTADGTDSALTELGVPHTELTGKQMRTVAEQFGTLGSGNHFVEVCLDERDRVWTVLHSGSRGIGNQLASKHIASAKALAKAWFIPLEDPDLAYFVQSMGTRSYIVAGKGNPASYHSCSHGAGRRMSRARARAELTVDSLSTAMGDRTWNSEAAAALLDEHPLAYKDIDQVMADQADLVEVRHTLRQVFNYKGT